jgi:hypothetical protein
MQKLTRMTCATIDGHGIIVMEMPGKEPVIYTLGPTQQVTIDLTDVQKVLDQPDVRIAMGWPGSSGPTASDGAVFGPRV